MRIRTLDLDKGQDKDQGQNKGQDQDLSSGSGLASQIRIRIKIWIRYRAAYSVLHGSIATRKFLEGPEIFFKLTHKLAKFNG